MSVRRVLLAMLLTLCVGAMSTTSLAASSTSTPPAGDADCPETTPEENAALVERYVEDVYNQHNPQEVPEFLADDFNRTNPSRPHVLEPGLEDDIARVERSLREFPDLYGTIDDVVAVDD